MGTFYERQGLICKHFKNSALRCFFSLSKKSVDFFDRLKKCRYFRAAQRRKSPRSAGRKPCCARLPGHLIPCEAGGCPLALPRPDTARFCSTEVFRHAEKQRPALFFYAHMGAPRPCAVKSMARRSAPYGCFHGLQRQTIKRPSSGRISPAGGRPFSYGYSR